MQRMYNKNQRKAKFYERDLSERADPDERRCRV